MKTEKAPDNGSFFCFEFYTFSTKKYTELLISHFLFILFPTFKLL